MITEKSLSGRRFVWALFSLALAARVGVVLRAGPPVFSGDSLEYHRYAVSVLENGRFEAGGSRATRMPGYPLFLCAAYAAAGPSPRAVQALQCLLGALTCLLIYGCARRLVAPPWAAACGLAAAFCRDLVAPSGWLLSECLYAFLLAAGFFALYREGWSARRRALCCAAAFGGAYAARPEAAVLVAPILAALGWRKGFSRRASAWGLAAFLAFPAAWAWRNARALGRPLPASSVGGFNAYLGLRLPLARFKPGLGPIFEPPAALGELDRDAAFLAEYRRLRAETSRFDRLRARMYNLAALYYPFLPEYDATYMLLFPFFLAGLWLARMRRELVPLAWAVLASSAVYAIFAGPVSRYRFGFAPCWVLLAACGAEHARKVFGPRRWRLAAGGWAAANLAVALGSPVFRRAALALKGLVWPG